ncbi:hypothetical protein [Fibrobacter sp. HC4]|uniref:Cap15 family cyclic dinucleotide receptor domain-containing protein n=1 Tax=Fibrobacter sp. HC4 TaxID=3239812 RepID=UPI0020190622|nr:hypothetical protein [Fibrobacter succinogenes]MCL4101225.1 hypothetical protein [Fibrobacter succinogenes]
MHEYVIKNGLTKRIVFFLTIAATSLSAIINTLFFDTINKTFGCFFAVSSWIIFVGLWFCFSKIIWKNKHIMKFLKLDNLSGKWLCEGTGFRYGEPNYKKNWNGAVTISQTYDEILIKLETEKSVSYSTQAQLEKIDDKELVLSYFYRNEPRSDSDQDMHKHYGSCRMFFDIEHGTAKADYFTDRDRGSFGSMLLTKG